MSKENKNSSCGMFGCLPFLFLVLGWTVGWDAALVIVGLLAIGALFNGISNKCPHCGKFGGLETVERETISESSPYNRMKNGELKVFVKEEYREIKRCSSCGLETEEIRESEREI